MDDINYVILRKFNLLNIGEYRYDLNGTISDILINNNNILYVFHRYVLKSRFTELECFLDESDIYYLSYFYSEELWPEMEEITRRIHYYKYWYEKHTGMEI